MEYNHHQEVQQFPPSDDDDDGIPQQKSDQANIDDDNEDKPTGEENYVKDYSADEEDASLVQWYIDRPSKSGEETIKDYSLDENKDENIFKKYASRPFKSEEKDTKNDSTDEEDADIVQWEIDRASESKEEDVKDYSSEDEEDASIMERNIDRTCMSHKKRKRKTCCNHHLNSIEIDILRNCRTELSKQSKCSCLQAMDSDEEQCDADYRAAMQTQPPESGRSSVRLVDLAILFGVYMIKVYLTDFLLMLVIILLIGLFLMRYWQAREEASFRCVHECPVHAIFPPRPPMNCHPGCSESHNPPCHTHNNCTNVCEHY